MCINVLVCDKELHFMIECAIDKLIRRFGPTLGNYICVKSVL